MFRISQYMHTLRDQTPAGPVRKPKGPVVIWNLIRRCNLTCKHCYSISADVDFPGELSTQQVYDTMDDLKSFGVPVLILSGGEPLLRPDIFEIGARAKEKGFYVGLSSNGTLIDESNVDKIAETGFNYVGVSLDGLEANHDKFRRKQGAFKASIKGIQLCKERGVKVGIRCTLNQSNYEDLPALLDLLDQYDLDKFYLSHLNYSGRGKRHRGEDAHFKMTRDAMNILFDRAWEDAINGGNKEFVTGNNDADGIFMLQWVERNLGKEQAELLKGHLLNWGGNASGQMIANIDNLGEVHPDTFWWKYNLGNVKEKPFSQIWGEPTDELMLGLRQSPRPVVGRCAQCEHLKICNGNTRTRAFALNNDFWSEDPGCYLTDEEIGFSPSVGDLKSNLFEQEQLIAREA